MVQKRMTRSLILLRSRCTHRGARTHILAIIPEIHRCVLELLSEKSQMMEGDSQVSVLEFYAACLVSATLAKYESLLVPSENRALVYFSHVVFCICQILPIFHSTELFWVAKRENRGGKKHDHFLSDAPCKSIVGTSNIFVCQKDH